MSRYRVYLAGAINGCTDGEANDWRDEVKRLIPKHVVVLDPMDRDYRGIEDENVKTIVFEDTQDIYEADMILVNAARPSWGTAMEVRMAYTEAHKQVIAIVPPDILVSPWLRAHTHHIVDDIQMAVGLLYKELHLAVPVRRSSA